jgi:hypothetical protein
VNILNCEIHLGFGSRLQKLTVREYLQRMPVHKGWHSLLQELFQQLFDNQWQGHLADCKEKFGTLRLYLEHSNDQCDAIVAQFEQRSAEICEFCGHTPARMRTNRSWIKSMCDACQQADYEANPTQYRS